MTIEIFKDSKKQFRFRLKSNNNKIIAQSEGYKRKAGAQNAIDAIRTAGYEVNWKLKDLTVK